MSEFTMSDIPDTPKVSREQREEHSNTAAKRIMSLREKVIDRGIKPLSPTRNLDLLFLALFTVFISLTVVLFFYQYYKTGTASGALSSCLIPAILLSPKGDFSQFLKLLIFETAKKILEFFITEQQRKLKDREQEESLAMSIYRRLQ